MQEVRLTIRKRAFPSRGRVRLNTAHLPDLGILEGEHIDLINENTRKLVTATVIADTLVPQGQVRVSAEDLMALGLEDGNEVLVVKTPPLQEKARKAVADANVSFTRGVDKLDAAVRKTAGEVKTEAVKAAGSLKEETRKASDRIGKAAGKTATAAKKNIKKGAGTKEDL
jgi:Fe2+ transport system protein FeoA